MASRKSASRDAAETSPAALPSASYLGLPWRLQDDDVGYEINASPVGWLWRVYLDDTIGSRKDDDPEFRALQKEHADFIIRAVNAHHDMLAALLHARNNMPHPDQMIDEAITKAGG